MLLNNVAKYDFPEDVNQMYLDSWDEKTRRQYKTYLDKWLDFCLEFDKHPYKCSIKTGIRFLLRLFKQGYAYSSLNTARSALSCVLKHVENVPFGQHHAVRRFMKAMAKKRPQLSSYQSTWDVNMLLQLFRDWGNNVCLSLKQLTMKVAALMLLTSCQRVQTLSTFKLSDLFWNKDKTVATFRISEPLKHSRRCTLGLISFRVFHIDTSICVVRALRSYLNRTKPFRKQEDRLFLSVRKDHTFVTKDTIAKWVRNVMTLAGIDVTVFKALSVRGATTSKMYSLHLPVKSIMAKACWKSEKTFQTFYRKEVMVERDVAHDMLHNFVQNRLQ